MSIRAAVIAAAGLGLILSAVSLLAQSPADTLTIPVTGSKEEGGVTYRFEGTLTFPRPEAIRPLPGPTICGMHDANGVYIRTAKPGDTVIVMGRDFGTAKGRMFWGVEEVQPLEWTDTAIRFVIPGGLTSTALNPRGHLLGIHRPDGQACASSVFTQ